MFIYISANLQGRNGTVQLDRTRDTPRAKQSYTENFRRTSQTEEGKGLPKGRQARRNYFCRNCRYPTRRMRPGRPPPAERSHESPAASPKAPGPARRPPAASGAPGRQQLSMMNGDDRVAPSAPPARRGVGGATSTAYQKVKSPFARKPVRATSEGVTSPIEEEKRRQAVLAHGRSVSVYGVAGEPEFVPEEEEVGADRYSIGEDGSVLTQGDFLTGAKIKRQSKSPGGEITF